MALVAELTALDALELLVTLELGEEIALAPEIVRGRTGGTGGTGGGAGRDVPVETRRERETDGVAGVDFELSTGVG